MTRIFDRRDECYVPVSILLDERERDMLDEAVAGRDDWERAIEEYAETRHLSGGERAKLRVAVYFYNGNIALRYEDPRRLDTENRERFVAAMRAHLDLPPVPVRLAALVIARGREEGPN